jgi:hypothetical protein
MEGKKGFGDDATIKQAHRQEAQAKHGAHTAPNIKQPIKRRVQVRRRHIFPA